MGFMDKVLDTARSAANAASEKAGEVYEICLLYTSGDQPASGPGIAVGDGGAGGAQAGLRQNEVVQRLLSLPVSYTHLDVYKRQGQLSGKVRPVLQPAARR